MTTQTLALLGIMLSDPEAEWYGLQLAELAGLKPGTVYPALARLEQAEWLSSQWEDVDPAQAGRPQRRLYRLSGHGADAAREALDKHIRQLEAARRGSPAWQPRPRRALG